MTETLLLSKFPSFILSKSMVSPSGPQAIVFLFTFFICDKISMLFTKGLLASSLDEIRNL